MMFVQNRLKVLQFLKSKPGLQIHKSAIFLSGNSVATRKWTDTEEPFRQESFFYYLSGVNEPDSHILLCLETHKATLIVPRPTAEHALWCGESLSPSDLIQLYKFNEIRYVDEINQLVQPFESLHVLEDLAILNSSTALITKDHLREAITESRVIKSEEEITVMRNAARISGEAHVAVWKAIGKAPQQFPTEAEVHAQFIFECMKRGASFQAYTGIVAGGRNAATLHYGTSHSFMHFIY
jgi:Xaa-Pro dipeptidase